MAVSSVNEIWDGRSASDNASLERNYTRVFRVICDDANDDRTVISPFVPQPRASHPNDAGAIVSDRSFEQQEDRLIWLVTVNYSSRQELPAQQGGGGGGAEASENPLARVPEWAFSTETYQVALEYDFHSTPRLIANSAGDPFDPPVVVNRARLVVTHKKNVAFYDPDRYANRLHHINVGLFGNYFQPYTLLYVDHGGQSRMENGIWYWEITNKFHYNPDGWLETEFVDRGYRGDIAETPPAKIGNLRDEWGAPLAKPALLNGSAARLPAGDDPVTTWADGSPFYLYDVASFDEIE